MTGTIGKQLASAGTIANGTSTSTSAPAASAPPRPAAGYGRGMVVLPAGFFGDLVSKFAGTIGEFAGGAFGNAALGKQLGEAAAPIAKLLPFTVIPPSVAPQSAGPDGGRGGSDQPLVVVPAGFLGGLLGGIGGQLLGGTIGDWLGDKQTGSTVGSTLGGVLGGILPFSVLPPAVTPASTGPDGAPKQEPLVVVPAGFFGHLLSGIAQTVSSYSGDSTVQTIATGASEIAKLLPFQDVPPAMVPQSAGPDGAAAPAERMIVVPAGFFGNLLGGLAETVGGAIGGAFGDKQTGSNVGGVIGNVLSSVLPFHDVPPQLLPQSAGPGGGQTQQELMVVPAGLFGGLLSTFAGAIGGAIGGLAGDAKTGQAIGQAASPFLNLLPFSVVPPRAPSAGS